MIFVLKRDYLIVGLISFVLIFTTYLFFLKIQVDNKNDVLINPINQQKELDGQLLNEEMIKNKGKIIFIDAGHGNFDPGAVSKNGTPEKDINLDISFKLKECLEKLGYKVLMTRENDEPLVTDKLSGSMKQDDLNKRKELINQSNADVLVSIHLNFFTSSSSKGMQTFYVNGSEEGKLLAKYIQDELQKDIKVEKKREILPIKSIYILQRTNIPGVIVECGFLSNPEDEENLKKNEYRKTLANAIANGIEKYFNQ